MFTMGDATSRGLAGTHSRYSGAGECALPDFQRFGATPLCDAGGFMRDARRELGGYSHPYIFGYSISSCSGDPAGGRHRHPRQGWNRDRTIQYILDQSRAAEQCLRRVPRSCHPRSALAYTIGQSRSASGSRAEAKRAPLRGRRFHGSAGTGALPWRCLEEVDTDRRGRPIGEQPRPIPPAACRWSALPPTSPPAPRSAEPVSRHPRRRSGSHRLPKAACSFRALDAPSLSASTAYLRRGDHRAIGSAIPSPRTISTRSAPPPGRTRSAVARRPGALSSEDAFLRVSRQSATDHRCTAPAISFASSCRWTNSRFQSVSAISSAGGVSPSPPSPIRAP